MSSKYNIFSLLPIQAKVIFFYTVNFFLFISLFCCFFFTKKNVCYLFCNIGWFYLFIFTIQLVFIIGASGSGKTTLIKALIKITNIPIYYYSIYKQGNPFFCH